MLLSRVADSLYWLSRYLERAEHAARLIDIGVDLGLGSASAGGDAIRRLQASLGLGPDGARLPGSFGDAAIFDPASRSSVISCVTAARENARQVREEISSEMWEQLNGLFLSLNRMRDDVSWAGRTHYVSRSVIDGVHLFQGITDATMGHGEGWSYLQAGRYIERAGATASLLNLFVVDVSEPAMPLALDQVEWVALLRSCSALEAYCRHYTADVRPERITEFLLLNAEFPRSVRFAAASLESAVRGLTHQSGSSAGARAERLAGRLHSSLVYGQVDEILSDDPHAYLTGIVRQCTDIHSALYQGYITYPIESALPA